MVCLKPCKFRKVRKDFVFHSIIAGQVAVPRASSLECPKCRERLFSPKEHQAIIDNVLKVEKKLITQQPIERFITTKMAADILGMTRQSFNRNKRIKRGFIMYHKMGDFSYYLRKSVEMYKKTSDGRYPL